MSIQILKKVGVLTGGGDCPGLNSAIRAVVVRGEQLGFEVIGIKNGWEGLIKKDIEILNKKKVSGILIKGGTILGSSRFNPLKVKDGLKKVIKNFKELEMEALIVIGGDDTLGVARRLLKSIPIVGIPKTIDNDIQGTDFCVGFYTAVQTAVDIIDKVYSTAESHHRVMVLEVMGRDFGWIAAYAGIAGGADYILIPENPIDINKICDNIKQKEKQGKLFSIIVVSEGAKLKGKVVLKTKKRDTFGHPQLGGIGEVIADLIEKNIKKDTRWISLGHILRGGTPCAFDRILATKFGVKAIELISKREFNKMVALKENKVISLSLDKVKGQKAVDKDIYQITKIFSQ